MLKYLIIYALICDTYVRGLGTLPMGSNSSNSSEAIPHHNKWENIAKYLNVSANPCEDFYNFACGNWKTHHPTNAGEPIMSTFYLDEKEFENKLIQLLDTADEMDTESERKVKDYYHSCVDAEWDSYISKANLNKIANEFGSGMPALIGDKWPENDFDWLQTVAEIYFKYGKTIIFGPSIRYNDRDHASYDIVLESDHLTSDTDEELNIVYDLNGLEAEEANQIFDELLNFDAILRNASQTKPKRRERIMLQDIHDKYSPDLNIMKLMNISFGSIMANDDEVFNENPRYVENLIEIMRNTPKKIVANYISSRLLIELYDGIQTKISNRACLWDTTHKFAGILSFMFYRTESNLKEHKDYVERMWQDIKLNLQMTLESSALNWFDENSREFALEKLHSVKLIVPSYEDKDLDQEYKHLHIRRSTYVKNQISFKAFIHNRFKASLSSGAFHHADYHLSFDSPYYSMESNTIVVPLSALATDHSFSTFYPNVYNYARLGSLLSHEVIHGFSGEGRQYNKLGDYRGKWDKDIENAFNKRRKCLYDQYHNYTYAGDALPQFEMQEENAADIGGILLAYQAYHRWFTDRARTKEDLDKEIMSNLNYTPQQLFFISYTQYWCSDDLEEERQYTDRSDPHSPDYFRAFVPLINFDAFARDFKCPAGSVMNPRKKCRIY